MVGDSLEADIFGAQQLKMKTVWLNSKGKINNTQIKPDFEIKELKELCEIL